MKVIAIIVVAASEARPSQLVLYNVAIIDIEKSRNASLAFANVSL